MCFVLSTCDLKIRSLRWINEPSPLKLSFDSVGQDLMDMLAIMQNLGYKICGSLFGGLLVLAGASQELYFSYPRVALILYSAPNRRLICYTWCNVFLSLNENIILIGKKKKDIGCDGVYKMGCILIC